MGNNLQRRVVVTGLGAVAPNGIGVESFWQATSNGVSGIALLQHQDPLAPEVPLVGGTVKNFIAEDYLDRKLINRCDRMTHFALAAIQEAMNDAHLALEQENSRRVGAVIANTVGGVNYVIKQLQALYIRGPRFVSAYTAIAWLNVSNVGQAAIRYGIQGYCKTPVNDTAGGLDAMGMAYNAIRRGAADVIITGGCEAFLHPTVLHVVIQQGLAVRGDDPGAYRPFDRRAAGLIIAEGAGICILEEYEHALKRGAPIYGEVVGYSQTNDARRLEAPSSQGIYYAKALQQALLEGEVGHEELAYLSLDGRAVPSSDLGEANALRLTFDSRLPSLPVSVPRTSLGHSCAAAGALDTITALLALKHGLIPPTINCEEIDPYFELNYGLDFVRNTARPVMPERQAVLLGGRGIGGTNVALALRKVC
jgi:3-oxoacyl-(acyl-carrier-protein) synthase